MNSSPTQHKESIILENVPYIYQQGRLDCGFASRAMLLSYFIKGFDNYSYPKLMYECASCYSFVYHCYTLNMPHWSVNSIDEEYEWLASLYGLSYERIVPAEDPQKTQEEYWNEFIDRISAYLQKNIPIQTTISWPKPEENSGKLYVVPEFRAFWWEGVSRKFRPQIHQLVVVGLDRSRGMITVNDSWGWLGKGKYLEIKFSDFKEWVENLPPRIRYNTRVFMKNHESVPDEETKQRWIRQRILKKLQGDPDVYQGGEVDCLYGVKGLRQLKEELRPKTFGKILEAKTERGIKPLEVMTYLNLGFHQLSFEAFIISEYLESLEKEAEWSWVSHLHILYEKLYILDGKLRLIFKASPELPTALVRSRKILGSMRTALDELICFIEKYLRNSGNKG